MLHSVLVSSLMRRSGAVALLLVLLSTTIALAVTLTLFTVSYDGANVRVDWEVSSETDVSGFDLYRKAATETTFSLVGSTAPTGQRRYHYIDSNVYRAAAGTAMSTPSATSFIYRLTIRSANGTEQSYTTQLAGTPSSVQRSWGTIKSMFR